MNKNISLDKIINFLDKDVIEVCGNTDNIFIKYLRPANKVDKYTLDWINSIKSNKQSITENSLAKVILVDETIQYTQELIDQKKVIIKVNDPKYCILKIGNHFFKENIKLEIHPTAIISSNAKLGNPIFIGANTYIGSCKIGNNVLIYPNVVINDKVIIGNNVIIKSGAVLGFDGFGYERDENNNLIKFPQLGNLIIHNNVEIGSNTCIDKGSLSDTIIGFNSKINNLCHIAHNVEIGKNVIVTAHVNISGSSIIEDDVWIGPNASLRGQQRIGKGATIGTGAVVTKNVPEGETWIGNPAKKMGK